MPRERQIGAGERSGCEFNIGYMRAAHVSNVAQKKVAISEVLAVHREL
jgi:hypothetical protein